MPDLAVGSAGRFVFFAKYICALLMGLELRSKTGAALTLRLMRVGDAGAFEVAETVAVCTVAVGTFMVIYLFGDCGPDSFDRADRSGAICTDLISFAGAMVQGTLRSRLPVRRPCCQRQS